MLGRPEMVVPVFMNVWAGSWLIASVCIERMMQRSSATEPSCGKSSHDLLPGLAELLELMLRPEAVQLLPLKLGDRLALGERLGHRLAVHLGQLRLVVERLQMRRPAGHVQPDDALGLRREVQRPHDAGPFVGVGLGLGEGARVEERCEREAADAARGLAEEGAALVEAEEGEGGHGQDSWSNGS